jgi:hypothetical protein
MPLRSFGVSSQKRFDRNLDTHTELLRRSLPRRGASWGVARKLLNIFLRNALYTGYLATDHKLYLAEDWFEIPLDSIVAKRLRQESAAELPRWLGVKHLTPEVSAIYQRAARTLAERQHVAAVHLDAVWWGGSRVVQAPSRLPKV